MEYQNAELEQILPEKIEERSFEIISRELAAAGKELDPENELVIKRAIHTTADFDYADNLVFSPGAVKLGIKALRSGAAIVTDTRMAWSGINKERLKRLGGEAFCFMADEDVKKMANERGITRGAASMDKASRLFFAEEQPLGEMGGQEAAKKLSDRWPVIFAIGNAPTALIRLYELIQEGTVSPALIIGVPVGFVNVIPSKERILSLKGTPYIVAKGRKGGSSVAAAICNALLYQA